MVFWVFATFMIPFQLSAVAILKRVRKAIKKFLKEACLPRPWHGLSIVQSEIKIKFKEIQFK